MDMVAYIIILTLGIINLFSLWNEGIQPAGQVLGFLMGVILISFAVVALVIT